MKNLLKKEIEESIFLKKKIETLSNEINIAIKKITGSLKSGGKIMLCGNGGSAADAQHLAAEFIVRLKPKVNRQPFPAITLATDTSTITACGNDYNFENIFARSFEALHKKGDILLLISTSGMSKNLIKVAKIASKKKIYTICFLGSDGGKLKNFSNLNIILPSNNTARIQEAHIFIGHHIFGKVESLLLNK